MSMQTYHELNKMLCMELDDMLRKSNGRIHDKEELEIYDMLSHALKSTETIIAMKEAEHRGESGRSMPPYVPHMSFDNGGLSGQRRDSMGRFSQETYESRYGGYSRDDNEMIAELHDLMNRTKDENKRMRFQRFIDDLRGM